MTLIYDLAKALDSDKSNTAAVDRKDQEDKVPGIPMSLTTTAHAYTENNYLRLVSQTESS